MSNVLLDTTVFHDYRGGDEAARALVERIMNGEITASVSPLTVLHLWADPGFDRPTEIGYFGMLSFIEEAPLSVSAAKEAALWLKSVEEEEREGLTHFALVAATASQRGEAICTRNPEPYTRFYSEILGY